MLLRHPLLIALFAGGCASLGFAPLNLWPLTLLGLAMLMLLVQNAMNWQHAARIGYCWGLSHFAINSNWIAHAFVYQDTMPIWLGWVAVLLFGVVLAVFVALPCAVAFWVMRQLAPAGTPKQNTLPFTLLFAATWIISELFRATILTGYAWDPIGVAMLHTVMRHAAPFVGTYGVSGIAVMIGPLFLRILIDSLALLDIHQWRHRVSSSWKKGDGQWLSIIMFALLFVPFALFLAITPLDILHDSAFLQARPLNANANIGNITIVQPNITMDESHDAFQSALNLQKLLAASGAPKPHHPRIIFWPESATTSFLSIDSEPPKALTSILAPDDILVTGGDSLVRDKAGRITAARNSVFVINGRGKILGRYDKQHLVPFGEYLPMRKILSMIGLNRLVPGDLEYLPGTGSRTFNIPGFGKMGGIICYEAIFSGEVTDPANRPDFIFNASNDAWYGDWGPPQHLAQVQMRALEEGLPIIRSTMTGISAVIDADGRVSKALPLHKMGVVTDNFPMAHAPTLFAYYGNSLPLIFAFLLGFTGIALMLRKRYSTVINI